MTAEINEIENREKNKSIKQKLLVFTKSIKLIRLY